MLSFCPDIVDYEREYTHILISGKTALVINKNLFHVEAGVDGDQDYVVLDKIHLSSPSVHSQ